ncbi:MAG: ATP-binding protein [Limnohabitans sp.]
MRRAAKTGVSADGVVYLATGAAAVAMTWKAGVTGGVFSPWVAGLLLLPLMPLCAVGRKAGLWCCAVVLAVLTGTGLLHLLQWLPSGVADAAHGLTAHVPRGVVVLVLVMGVLFCDRRHQAAWRRRRSDQQALERQRAQLDHASRAHARFMAEVSHELRTHMNVILGSSAWLLARAQARPEALKLLQHTRQSADHMMTVVNDVLDQAQWQSGRLQLHPEVFALHEVVRHAFELFLPRVGALALDYRLELDPALPRWVHSDRHRLTQVLVNLLGNALKFTPVGSVVLRVQWLDPGVLFSVQDTGIGMAPSQHARIFQRFTQANAGIRSRYGGSGLGLAISQELVHLLRGEIGFESTEGIGSRFWFRLPLQASEAPTRAGSADTSAPMPMQTAATAWRFLVVDDHRLGAQLVERVLREAWPQAVITLAADGRQCLARLAQGPVDLVLMGMAMPVMDGVEATRHLRQNPAWQQLPVLGLTANVNPTDLEVFQHAGLNALMLKPFEPVLLCARIEQMLQRR